MDALLIVLAIPTFFVLIGVELLVAKLRNRSVYRFQDSINSLSAGISQQAAGIFMVGWVVGGYVFLHDRLAVWSIDPRSWIAWIALLFAVDFAYYLFHWASHRVNIIWATHVVHHQSEEYNLSTALRQSALQGGMSAVFYWPLAIVGFPPLMFVTMSTINTLYQFWIHTRLVGKLGPLEWFLNTPSHHRVHHGIDPKYIDKNFAGIFIVWDRLFGTFQPEEEEPVYGTVKPLASWNPVYANVEHWVRLWRMSLAAQRMRDKLAVWFMPPEWRPADLGGKVVIPEVDRTAYRKYEVAAPSGSTGYVAVQFVLVAAGISAALWLQEKGPTWLVASLALWIVVSVAAWGGIFERRRWASGLEAVRLVAIPGLVHWMTGSVVATLAAGAWAILSLVWLGRVLGVVGPARIRALG